MKTRFLNGLEWLLAVSIGSLITSFGFYEVYGHWEPMVWASGVVSLAHIFRACIKAMEV